MSKLPSTLINSTLLSDMTEGEIDAFFNFTEKKKFSKNSTIFIQNMDGQSLYLIADGMVELTWMVTEGTEKKLAELAPGECFGEMAIFNPGPRAVTARVVEDAEIYILSKEKLNELREKEPKVCLNFVLALSKKLAHNLRDTVGTFSDLIEMDS